MPSPKPLTPSRPKRPETTSPLLDTIPNDPKTL
jgi:hypothetical protein